MFLGFPSFSISSKLKVLPISSAKSPNNWLLKIWGGCSCDDWLVDFWFVDFCFLSLDLHSSLQYSSQFSEQSSEQLSSVCSEVSQLLSPLFSAESEGVNCWDSWDIAFVNSGLENISVKPVIKLPKPPRGFSESPPAPPPPIKPLRPFIRPPKPPPSPPLFNPFIRLLRPPRLDAISPKPKTLGASSDSSLLSLVSVFSTLAGTIILPLETLLSISTISLWLGIILRPRIISICKYFQIAVLLSSVAVELFQMSYRSTPSIKILLGVSKSVMSLVAIFCRKLLILV